MRYIITAAVTAFLIAGIPAQADRPVKEDTKKSRVQLLRENNRYRTEISFLKARLDSIEREMSSRDSLASEIMDIYESEAKGRRHEIEYDMEVTDSLLNIWYLHESLGDSVYVSGNIIDSVTFQSNVPDSVYIKRIKEINSFITLPYNNVVRNNIILYSEKLSEKMGIVLGLARYYFPIFDEIFDRYGLPEELKAMSIIESMLNPLAVSRAGAKGMWQFMYGTAKHYGLTINSFVDQRMDPVASADAAARYLKDSYDIFGDWNLAIASYNCGAGNVSRAIRRSGGKREFWDIYPYLPRETRGYVPAFVGALYTMKYYKEHGIVPQTPALPGAVDTIRVDKMLHFKQVEALVGIPQADLRNLNPQYRHDIVPGSAKEVYSLTIPFNYVNAYIDVEDTLYTYKAEEYFNPVNIKKIQDGGDGERIVYKVRSGDVLGKIASRYRVSVAQIKRWNNLKSNTIRVGQRLVIYKGGTGPSTSSSASTASSATKTSTSQASAASSTQGSSKPSSQNYTIYEVKSGDNLYEIAKKYPGVSAQNIMDFNGIGSKINPGMKLKIPAI
ncbi:MAG: LysM peptidoglycan-binding domain-containing protein [Candidatus Cryptobacteroides sp.]